ncbi:hypothetical protein ES703_121698 [subsurface metagenome]
MGIILVLVIVASALLSACIGERVEPLPYGLCGDIELTQKGYGVFVTSIADGPRWVYIIVYDAQDNQRERIGFTPMAVGETQYFSLVDDATYFVAWAWEYPFHENLLIEE